VREESLGLGFHWLPWRFRTAGHPGSAPRGLPTSESIDCAYANRHWAVSPFPTEATGSRPRADRVRTHPNRMVAKARQNCVKTTRAVDDLGRCGVVCSGKARGAAPNFFGCASPCMSVVARETALKSKLKSFAFRRALRRRRGDPRCMRLP